MLSKGFPVGKVDFLTLGPMSFEEFLEANGDQRLVSYLKSIDTIEPVPEIFAGPLTEKLKMYYVVGGMPEAVLVWTENRDVSAVDRVQSDILAAYEHDFAKHADKTDVPKIRLIWDSLPSQLARENKKFLYSAVKTGARAREYENALLWLKNADLIKKVPRITRPGIPLSAYEDLSAFKIYMPDVGLLRRHARLAASAFTEENRLFTEFKGALTENYVLQNLLQIKDVAPYYWSDGLHEVDFAVQFENDIFPVEAKAGRNIGGASVKAYTKAYEEQTRLILRCSLQNLSLNGKVLNVPLFLLGELRRLTECALRQRG